MELLEHLDDKLPKLTAKLYHTSDGEIIDVAVLEKDDMNFILNAIYYMRKRIKALETANDLLYMESQEYEIALKEIAESDEDSSCNELALKYEVIAEKALSSK